MTISQSIWKSNQFRFGLNFLICLLVLFTESSWPLNKSIENHHTISLHSASSWEKSFRLNQGESVQISIHLPQPSLLPSNGLVGVTWKLAEQYEQTDEKASKTLTPDLKSRELNDFGIYTKPTPNWKKVLHALDPDLFLVYRAPVSGTYILNIAPEKNLTSLFNGPRWRETGLAPQFPTFSKAIFWPKNIKIPIEFQVVPINLKGNNKLNFHVEHEPNDTPEQAQLIPIPYGEKIQRILITAGADDIEYFDNGKVGQSGDDWFRFNYNGSEQRLLTCNLTLPDHTIAARLRFYTLDLPSKNSETLDDRIGNAFNLDGLNQQLLPLLEYTKGRNQNERVHQQNEEHRAEINRLLEPGGIYFLRAEANAPGYELELRVLKPAPYKDPKRAVKQAMYDHLGQVDSWLSNRPRGASVERRIRDAGNLLGTHCMSCHTQAGVWGPAVPLENGYKIENVQNFRRLVNIMYESLRPTNYLKNAANNTSLAPLDVGDGPAGTRVAGHNVCTVERVVSPRKLHSQQLIRVANHVLQTADPSGINAAGPGSNVGQAVVFSFAGEILYTAWNRTSHPRYFAAMEKKAQEILKVEPKYSDDLSHRIEFFHRFFPQNYLEQNQRAQKLQKEIKPLSAKKVKKVVTSSKKKEPKVAEFPEYRILSTDESQKLWSQIRQKIIKDEKRLRRIQNSDGSWGFDPGKTQTGSGSWETDGKSDPAPTALALIALESLGYRANDPAISRGVEALLKMQKPYGLWNESAQTGFVTTGYALHALSRLFPASPVNFSRKDFVPSPNESLIETLKRVRTLSHTEDFNLVDLMIKAAQNPNPLVRYWGVMALGGIHQKDGVSTLIQAMSDPSKMVRDASAWAMEQTLLDDLGFDKLFAAYDRGNDATRETILKALGMRADTVMTNPDFNHSRLVNLLSKALNYDPHPGVRAWATKAIWQWWDWNPPMRKKLQQAWEKRLLSVEPNSLVEHSIRYQSHALFIANGHKANSSKDHQYPELKLLFKSLNDRLDDTNLPIESKDLLARRLVQIGATFYNTSGGDGGPGQMGYATPGSAEMMGKAVLHYWKKMENLENKLGVQLALEAASSIPFPRLQDRLIDFATNGPEDFRTLAAGAISDPSAVTLPATQEQVQPMIEQIYRGAQVYERRKTLADPMIQLISRAGWTVPQTLEQQTILYKLLIPAFEEKPNSDSLSKILEDAANALKNSRTMDADWFIADRMGKLLASNPDLHTNTLTSLFPSSFSNPLSAHFWLPSADWVSNYEEKIPDIVPKSSSKISTGNINSELIAAKIRARKLLVQMLNKRAPEFSRMVAVKIAHLTAYRRDPIIQKTVRKLIESESNKDIKETARNILKWEPTLWFSNLQEALASEPLASTLRTEQGEVNLTDEFLDSFHFFSDFVAPELNRPKKGDGMACMSCHGVPGRVPSMELERPDGSGYLSVSKMLKNYLILKARVNLRKVKKSKLLRKPLNVQTGKEDGHQGGRRYTPSDRGYQIIKKWSSHLPKVQKSIRQLKSSKIKTRPNMKQTKISKMGRSIHKTDSP